METRTCPNPSCGEELSQSRSNGFLHLYCTECGYEAKEQRETPRQRWTAEERRRNVGGKIIPLQGRQQKQEKVKLNRDRDSYMPRRGTR